MKKCFHRHLGLHCSYPTYQLLDCLTLEHLPTSHRLTRVSHVSLQDRVRAEQARVERERQLELMRQEQNEERRREREQAAKAQEQMMQQLQQDLCCASGARLLDPIRPYSTPLSRRKVLARCQSRVARFCRNRRRQGSIRPRYKRRRKRCGDAPEGSPSLVNSIKAKRCLKYVVWCLVDPNPLDSRALLFFLAAVISRADSHLHCTFSE